MYPSSQPHRPSAMASQGGLTSNSSAQASLLTVPGGVDHEFSTVGSDSMRFRFFNADSSSLTLESGCKADVSPDVNEAYRRQGKGRFGGATSSSAGLQWSSGFKGTAVGDFSACSFRDGGGGGVCTASTVGNAEVPSSSKRNSSSPAAFHKQAFVDNTGFCITEEIGSYSSQTNGGSKFQLTFTSMKESHSPISQVTEGNVGGCSSGSNSFPIGSWGDKSIIFLSDPSKRGAKIVNGDIVTSLHGLDTQFNLSRSSLEMASVDKYLHMNQDLAECRIRAKPGCATHPRSIAERERRTRISEKLKKLQELVPNMDKQTSTADMLDLAVQHIKSLQGQMQKLKKNIEKCRCGCRIER